MMSQSSIKARPAISQYLSEHTYAARWDRVCLHWLTEHFLALCSTVNDYYGFVARRNYKFLSHHGLECTNSIGWNRVTWPLVELTTPIRLHFFVHLWPLRDPSTPRSAWVRRVGMCLFEGRKSPITTMIKVKIYNSQAAINYKRRLSVTTTIKLARSPARFAHVLQPWLAWT